MFFEGVFMAIVGILLIVAVIKSVFSKRVARVVAAEKSKDGKLEKGKFEGKNKAVTARYDKILMNIEIYDGTENGQNKV